MCRHAETVGCYRGFEQGPIRPPSEAGSLLVRVTRNCPWNRCTFCPVYKGRRFSLRPVEDVKQDIDAVSGHVDTLRELADQAGRISPEQLSTAAGRIEPVEAPAFEAACHWSLVGGTKAVFIQDANSLVIRTADLVEILNYLKKRFPSVKRITSYARAHTIASMKDEDLRAVAAAGLDRVHLGMESGCDRVLARVKKGVTREQHIVAGLKAKKAGLELSEYVMPGLGGRGLSEVHALETADALNHIDPAFIRVRTLAVPDGAPLAEDCRAGRFHTCTDLLVARELATFIENLDGITSTVVSDHILNLFQDVEGTLPQDKNRMLEVIHTFLAMEPHERMLYQVGRRAGIFSRISHLEAPRRKAEAQAVCRQLGVTPRNVDEITGRMMKGFL